MQCLHAKTKRPVLYAQRIHIQRSFCDIRGCMVRVSSLLVPAQNSLYIYSGICVRGDASWSWSLRFSQLVDVVSARIEPLLVLCMNFADLFIFKLIDMIYTYFFLIKRRLIKLLMKIIYLKKF